jgi:hypothetical protein
MQNDPNEDAFKSERILRVSDQQGLSDRQRWRSLNPKNTVS